MIEELIEKINSLELPGTPWVEDSEVSEILGKPVATDLDADEHRWYVTSTDVYQVGDSFLGVNGPSMLRSESMGFEDLGYHVTAFEMEQVETVTYREKKKPVEA